ncbi:MAG: DMT family transporter [Rhodoferax sp.]|nr:DMT family transporter [Rhodoferax sp.]
MTAAHLGRPWLAEFILLAAIWGSSFLFTRLGVAEFGALATAGVRVSIAALFLTPLMLARGHGPTLAQHWRKIFFLGLLNSGIPFACYAYALLSISTGLSALLNATVPLFGALVAWLWLKDRPHGLKILGLLIGFVGVAMLAWGKASFKPDASGVSSGWAVVACLLATLCYGIAASYTRRYLGGVSSLVVATGSQIGAALGLALPTYWFWPNQTPGTSAWLALLVVGVLCTGIAYVLYFRLIDKMGVAASLTVTFLIPVFAVIYGVIFLAETVTTWMLICGVVILTGTALSVDIFKWRQAPAA